MANHRTRDGPRRRGRTDRNRQPRFRGGDATAGRGDMVRFKKKYEKPNAQLKQWAPFFFLKKKSDQLLQSAIRPLK